MKKKIISGLLAMSLLATSGSYAFAEGNINLTGNGAKGNTTLNKTVAENVTVIIPESLEIPHSNETFGSEIGISVAERSVIATGHFVNVKLAKTQKDGTPSDLVEQRSVVRLTNGASHIYSPLRLSKSNKGGDIHNGGAADDLYSIPDDGIIATFKPGDDGTGSQAAGYTGANYKLYAYRGYTSPEVLNNVADDAMELKSGTYKGIITFELEISDKEPIATPEAMEPNGFSGNAKDSVPN